MLDSTEGGIRTKLGGVHLQEAIHDVEGQWCDAGQPGFDSRQGRILFLATPKPSLRPTHHPIHWARGFSRRGKASLV